MALQLAPAEKSPFETLDYSFDFGDFLSVHQGDAIASWTVGADVGITLSNASEADGVVRVLAAGGSNKRSYRIVADITTVNGLVDRQERLLRVRGQAVNGNSVTGIGVITFVAGQLYLDDQRLLLDNSFMVLS